jgi:hypothetical protein
LRIPVDIFGGFGVQSKEIRYTQFLASVLDGNQGARSQIVAWTALCELVAQKYRQRQDGHLAKLWSHAKSCLPESVRPEVTIPPPKAHSSAGGKRDARPDILILTEDLHILVELKLGGDWNESKTSHQAHKYETYLNNMDLHGRTRSLVSIARQRLERKEGSSFLNLTWCEYSTELRRCLRTKSNGIGAHSELPDELGVLLLLGGIERHQVGLQIPKCLRALLAADPQVSEDSAPVPEWFQVHSQLSHLHHYLKTST